MLRRLLYFFALTVPLLAIVACSDGSDGAAGTSTSMKVTEATLEQCVTGGKVYTVVIDGVEQPDPQVVCNGLDGSDGENGDGSGSASVKLMDNATAFAPCVTCHITQANENINSIHVAASGQHSGTGTSGCGVCHGGGSTAAGWTNGVFVDNTYGTETVSLVAGPTCYTCHIKPVAAGAARDNATSDNNSILHWNFTGNLQPGTCGTGAYNPATGTNSACHSGYHGATTYRGSSATTKWQISAHGYNDNGTALAALQNSATGIGTGHNSERCVSCHNGAYFKDFVIRVASAFPGKTGAWSGDISAKYFTTFFAKFGNKAAVMNTWENTAIGCTTCHNPHSTGLKTKQFASGGSMVVKSTQDVDITLPAGTVVYSAEYLLCTSCHTTVVTPYVIDTAATPSTRFDNTTKYFEYVLDESVQRGETRTDRPYHDDRPDRSIADTHFAGKYGYDATVTGSSASPVYLNNPDSYTEDPSFAAGGYITLEGYGVDASSPIACSSCHDVHLTSKMGFYNKHANATNFPGFNEGTAASDTWNMYRLTMEAKNAGHIGVNKNNSIALGFAARVTARSASCAKCHNPVRAKNVVAFGTSSVPNAHSGGILENQIGLINGAMDNETWSTIGCVTCHDMSKTQDNASGVKFPRITGVYPVANNFNFNFGWYISAATPAAAPVLPPTAERTLGTTLTKAFGDNSSLACINCHVGRSAPSLIGKIASDNSTITAVSTHGLASALNVLGKYYTFSGQTYVAPSTHSGVGEIVVNSCIACHGVNKETHQFVATEMNADGSAKILGKGCGGATFDCHNGVVAAPFKANADSYRDGVSAFYKIFGVYAAGLSAADNATLDVIGAKANRGLIRQPGTAIHGGKLARQVAWDSMVAIHQDPATIVVQDGFTAQELAAMRGWLGNTRPQ